MKKDIENSADIQLLVNTFYDKVKEDPNIGFFFSEIIPVNWNTHLPRMYSFWESVLLGEASYKGNPVLKHVEINQKHPLQQAHFGKWLELWKQTIDELFEGPTALCAQKKPEQMIAIMMSKINPISISVLSGNRQNSL
ncbi:hemoglobin [Filimonas lacunae]|uniref:Hemoglobin n=1 Tax=Filimonas lacunae TaxID=477680 RepID=A0A173MF56_9BACT|nr:group III truncated hemoglobin [Filimonas lacunae]BAV06126.1 truncated hemoglobins [Filimonas lacunae]SIT24771.1 hemoglobin [Filimonas lacunae]